MTAMRPSRRAFLTAAFAPLALRQARTSSAPSTLPWAKAADRVVKKGRLKQSVSRWPYAKIP
jgi:hypothetical protein